MRPYLLPKGGERSTPARNRMSAIGNTGTSAKAILALCLVLFWTSPLAAAAADEPYRVLVLHSFRNSVPVNADWHKGLMRGFASASDLAVEIDTEAPNLVHLSEPGKLDALRNFYRTNYQERKPQLIVSTYTPALQFLLAYGDDLFPGVPVVFVGADQRVVAAHMAPHVTGITGFADIAGTLELALRAQPDTQRVAVIVGSGPVDKVFERDARQALGQFDGQVDFVWLRGLSTDELVDAVGGLPEQTVVLFLVQTEDRSGKPYVPRTLLQAVSPASKGPVFGLWDSLLGHGIIGGRLALIEEDGAQAAQTALRILRGESPATIPIDFRKANPAIIDGREMARWKIDENRLPADVTIVNRPQSAWDQHRTAIMITVSVVALQGLLIAALLCNRRRLKRAQTALSDEYARRAEAETLAGRLRARLARFSKERSLGTMATSISHEINQPLIAIQNYAQAARRRLEGSVDDKSKLIELVAKIEGQAERAGAITQRVRELISKTGPWMLPTPLEGLLEEVTRAIEPEARSRHCHIVRQSAVDAPAVLADALEVQLVLVNLLQNAMRSVCSDERFDRHITIDVRTIDEHEVQVSVTDGGVGVPPDQVEEIFEPLYSGEAGGLGMGLSISRAIIESHGGRLWHEANPAGGAVFRFTLRAAGS